MICVCSVRASPTETARPTIALFCWHRSDYQPKLKREKTMAKAKVVAINKTKEVSDAIEALQARWEKYKKQDYSSAALRTAVERIVSAAEEMLSSLDGVPFGFT